jgi:AraC-like DNA-binding protein
MLIYDNELLKKYYSSKRLWQGIPSIEVTKKGRIFLTFYSGGTKEEVGNFSLIVKSDDGENFSEPIVVAFEENHRCFDPCIWIDPQGRLWWTWSKYPDDGLWGAICDDPDADEIKFCEPFFIGHNIMMNKPTVLSTGEWLFPIAIWVSRMATLWPGFCGEGKPGAYAYSTIDGGKTFKQLGAADVANRSFDEHYFLEMNDGRIRCFVRTNYGIGAADSFDGGKSFGKDFDTGLGGPSSRFFIKRLASGRLLLINHYDFTGRNNLTAMLSEDDGKTWPYKLLLDERSNVSYPDAKEAEDGFIYITYDRDRGGFKSSIEEAYACAREILIAKICESDIISGAYGSDSYTKRVASKLTTLAAGDKNPFLDEEWDNRNFAKMLIANKTEDPIGRIFIEYPINCINIASFDAKALDKKIAKFEESGKLDEDLLVEIIEFIRKAPTKNTESSPIVAEAKKIIDDNLSEEITLTDIAEKIHVSAHYLAHLFKSTTGTTLFEYRNEERLTRAKHMLINTDKSITDVANEVGFASAAYFTKIFSRSEKTTPREFRKIHKS